MRVSKPEIKQHKHKITVSKKTCSHSDGNMTSVSTGNVVVVVFSGRTVSYCGN